MAELSAWPAPAAKHDPRLDELRGLSRGKAADYIGVGVTKFDEMVADGRMPQPKPIDGRLIWDRWALDEAFSALPDREKDNPWDR